MKSVLHKSFKPAKCKTSLKLAVSRIKLMRNKKEVVLRQLKREVAQLLESGQDQSARIRVEHVIREEKMMAAYDLVEIYCELIVARLPIIESQKNCPIDLKEAVSSIIFASPRCADIPELMDVRKQLMSKYGREFVTAAVELRPECGVSRMLVEKLSAIAPDGPLKVKVLTDIANEHNIKWEPDWFKDKDSDRPEDLLNVPGTGRDSRIHVESPSPNVEWRDRIPSIIHKPPVIPQNSAPADIDASQMPPVMPQNSAPADIGASQIPPVMPQNSAPEYTDASHMPSTGNFYPEARPEGAQQNFYKDATAAAQAAAESAERASMAARAAVELSSRDQNTSHNSMEIPSSSIYGRDQGRRTSHPKSKVYVCATQGEHLTQNLRNNSFQGRSPGMPDQQRKANEREGQRGGFGDMSFKEDCSQLREEYKVDRPEVMESVNSNLSKKSIRGQTRSSLSGRSSSSDQCENNMPDSPLFDEPADMISGLDSSRLQSDDFGEQYGISSNNNRQRYGNNSSEDLASGFHQGITWKEEWGVGDRSHHSPSYPSAFYDENDGVTSRSDSHKYDVENKKGPFVDLNRGSMHSCHSPSYSRAFYDEKDDVTSGLDSQEYDMESKKGPFFDLDRGSPHSPSYSRSFYDEKDDVTPRMDSQKYDVENKKGPFVEMDHGTTHSKAGAVFDESDSDGDDCMVNTVKDNVQNSSVQSAGEKWGMHSTFSSKSMYQQELSESFKQSSLYSQLVEPVPLSFDDSDGQDSESEEERRKSEARGKIDTVVPGTDSWEPEILPKTSPGSIQSSYRGNRTSSFSSESFENSPYLKESHEISSPKLVFPELSSSQASSPGYTKSKSSDLDRWSSSSRGDTEKDKQSKMDSFHEEESNLESGMELNYRSLTGGLRHKGYRLPPYTKDTASSQVPAVKESEDSDVKFARGIHDPESNIVRVDLRKGSCSRTPETLINDSSEDDVPKESPIRKGRPSSSLSRRTKASLPRAGAGSTSSPRMRYEASSPTDYTPEIEQSSPYRYASEAISKDRTTITSSGFSGERDTRSKFLPRTSLEEGSSAAVRGKTSPTMENSVAARSIPEFSKNANTDEKAPSREKSVKKNSHVHPKLPDYDSLAAHLQSLRVNRK